MNQIEFKQHLKNAINFYYQNGIECFPVRLERESNGKKRKPECRHHWRDSITLNHSLWAIDKFDCTGVALKTGAQSNLFVVDIETPVEENLKALELNGIVLPEHTLKSVTQSGGVHYYFRFDSRLNDTTTTDSKVFGEKYGVDIRGNGGLIYAEPTFVVNGGQYQFLGGQIQPIPEPLIQFLLNRPVTAYKSKNQGEKRANKDRVPKEIDEKFEPPTVNDAIEMVKIVSTNCTVSNKDDQYKLWLKITNALFHQYGYDTAYQILQQSMPEKNIGEYFQKFKYKYDTVTIGSLVWLAQQHGSKFKPKFKNRKVGELCNVEK